MLSVPEALDAILQQVDALPPCRVPINEALNRILAEGIVSDVDSPPFDKALMDGFALRSADAAVATADGLSVVEEIAAGAVGKRTVGPGEAARIMTGAPIPEGIDTIVPVELTAFDPATNRVRVEAGAQIAAGAHILRRGTSMRQGDTVLEAGRILRPQELGSLAEMGIDSVPTRPIPTVAVLATGDELVEVGAKPGPGQIRNSNETMLIAQIQRAGGAPRPLGIARDNRESLRAKIEAGLENDVLLLSGGVSAGKFDLVPAELEAAGVKQVFHKVRVKPGKPLWFGVLDTSESALNRRRFVFGLPGNPVSSMVCFELFARTAVRRLMGDPNPAPRIVRAKLASAFAGGGDRDTYYPCQLDQNENGVTARLADWRGSADLRTTVDADALAVFPAGVKGYQSEDVIDVIRW